MTDHRRSRTTLSVPTARLSGIGLHTGLPSWIEVHPASPATGIVFADQDGGGRIPALSASVADTSRCTQLAANGAAIQTVEHLLSALAGCGVDDAEVRFSGVEIPAADGSAAPFAVLLRRAGIIAQADGARCDTLELDRPLLVEDPRGGSVLALPSAAPSYTVVIDYPSHPYIGTQSASFDPASEAYDDQIAHARTYGFASELDTLRARGLALGASRENALALGEHDYLDSLRYDNELARHKLLDLIGDLALVGRPVAAQFVAIKPSHALNSRTALALSMVHQA